jgi:hypothetical protein
MKDNSKKKKRRFENFIIKNQIFIEGLKGNDKEENKKLKFLMNSYKKFNTTDYARIPTIYEFYQNHRQYWDHFTIGEMEFLGIFLRKTGRQELFEEVADKYLQFLIDNDYQNRISYLKGIMSKYQEIKVTPDTVDTVKKILLLVEAGDPDIIQIRKEVATLCTALKVNDDLISYYTK